MLPPPTLEGKLEWFFAHLSLGQITVIPEALSREGLFPVVAHCNAQFWGHISIQYRCVSLFISYNEGMMATSLDFRVFGGRRRDRCNLLTNPRIIRPNTSNIVGSPGKVQLIVQFHTCDLIALVGCYPSKGYSPFRTISNRAYFYDMISVRLVTTVP